jgi:hypothetical protein
LLLRGFLWLCPFVPGAEDRHFLSPRAGDAYTLWEAHGHA